MKGRFLLFLLVGCLLVLSTGIATSWAARSESGEGGLPSYQIGIVTDGPLNFRPNIVSAFKKEIRRMAQGEFTVSFPKEMTLEANETREDVNKHIQNLLENPACDLIITLGMIGSTEMLQRTDLSKPVVAPLVYDAKLQKAPKEGIASGVKNLFYIDLGTPVDQEMIVFRKLVPFKHMALILDERDVKAVSVLARLDKYLSFEHSIKVDLVTVAGSVEETVAKIPETVEAVLVGPIWNYTFKDMENMSERLIARKLPSFAIANYDYLESGFLATTMPQNVSDQLARQVAINIQEIMLGEEPGKLPVAFAKSQKLAINMATARAIEVYPSLDYMTGAKLLNDTRDDISRRVTLDEVVAEALKANRDLAIAQQDVVAGSYSVNEARSDLLPQLGVAAGGRVIDDDRASLSQGSTPERALTGTLTASQQLYSESSWTNYTVEKYTQSGREYNRDSVELDVIFEAATAYLEVLRRKTIERLQIDNMKLTQANLERSQIRLSIGVAGPDELYRWQTQFANDRQIVLQAESASFDAMQALNRIIARPLQEEFLAEETDLSDPLLIGGDQLFYQLIHNPLNFRKFKNIAIEEGMKASPEIKFIDSAIASQERLIEKARREYWAPTVTLEGEVEQLFSDSGEGQRDEDLTGLDDTDWSVGVFARLPLFEGGRKSSALGRNKEQLKRLRVERRNTEERISQGILQALNNTRASYPSINLSRDAVDAARRNLKLVTDSYVQGIKSIIDLLDAQNQALNAELDAANAVYNFLIDYMGVQRNIGTFFTFMESKEREKWTREIEESLQVQK